MNNPPTARDDPLLVLALRVADDPSFVSFSLARHRATNGTTPAQQAAALGLELDQLAALALCRAPRSGVDRQADLEQIAAYAGLRVEVVEELIAAVQV
jgi:hypothetical protein